MNTSALFSKFDKKSAMIFAGGAALLLFLGFLFIFSPVRIKEIKAGSGQNTSGFAWSENIGWVSFNSTNCDANGDGLSDGTPAGCPPVGSTTANYGVHIDPSTGNFSGYAWSENIGWVKFDPASPYPESPNYSAKLDLVSSKVTGWARACAGTENGDCNSATRTDGWDGWIKMAGSSTDSGSYGVSRSGSALTGWAWGSDVVGWLSFNCQNQGWCATSSYKVQLALNTPAYVQTASPQVTSQAYCGISQGAGQVGLEWIYKDEEGDNQSQYNLQVATDAGFVNKVVDCVVDQGGIVPGQKGTSAVKVVSAPATDCGQVKLEVGYNTPYYWRVKVKAAAGNLDWSGWETGPSFTTAVHAYPWINFDWAPKPVTAGQKISFTDQSTVYGGAAKSAWLWTFQDGSPNSTTTQNPPVSFTSKGNKTVSLKVTDTNGFNCTDQKTVTVQVPLPEWKEIPPQ